MLAIHTGMVSRPNPIVAPPRELATLLLSQGASFVRWLASVDQGALLIMGTR
jgi:hypothetical protein